MSPKPPRHGSLYEVQFARRISLEGLPEPVLQYQFALELGRRWVFDFAWPDRRIAAEVDGGARLVRWQRNPRTGKQQPVAVGRHGQKSDLEKLNAAAQLGWRVWRFNPEMLRDGAWIVSLKAALMSDVIA